MPEPKSQVSNRVRIYTLSCKGMARKDITNELKLSEARVREIQDFFEGNGLIKRCCNRPVLYVRNSRIRTPHPPVQDSQPYTYILPHHVGADFLLKKKLPLGLYKNGIFLVETRAHTALFRQKSATISMHHFRGVSPDEILKNAESDLIALADMYGRKYSTTLSLTRLIPYIEWADTDEERSKKICEEGKIAKRDWKIVDNVKHKNTDFTDDTLELEPISGFPNRPLSHARRHHALYSGEYESRIAKLEERENNSLEREERAMEREERVMKLLEKFGEDNEKTAEILSAIQQRMNLEAKKK